MRKINLCLILAAIIIVAIGFRSAGFDWDWGFHLHPDEREIILVSSKLFLPKPWGSFFSPSSLLNPHFFAYGSFPLYLLRVAGALFLGSVSPGIFYSEGLYIGRLISICFDLGTLFFLFLIAKKLAPSQVALLTAFFYAISVLPIQLAHFYTADTILTFFTTAVLFLTLSWYEKPTTPKLLFIGILWGFALATKVSAVILILPLMYGLIVKQLHKYNHPQDYLLAIYQHHQDLYPVVIKVASIVTTTIITFCILEPYAIINFSDFWRQTQIQNLMTGSAFYFPYTLQYVGKVPYWYELKNIFLWGLGPCLSIVTLCGTLYVTYQNLKKKNIRKEVILLVFFWIYFFVVGSFAVGFMRYMLPLYPFFCLFGAIFIYQLVSRLTFFPARLVLYTLLFAILLIWPLSFVHIYQSPNTRILATNWILRNIPPGKTIAIEHWDDSLPLIDQKNYTMITLPLYNPDTPRKWKSINQEIAKSDYIILASNRLYVPLQKLTDCQKLPPMRCYPQTASYYKNLFSGALGFQKVAEFAVYPTIPFTNITINDQGADESFTVYDHPKIMIFQKQKP